MPTWGSDSTTSQQDPKEHTTKGWRPSRRGLVALVMGVALAGAAGVAVVAGGSAHRPATATPPLGNETPPATQTPPQRADTVLSEESLSWPWAAIGRVTLASGGYCTGTLITPDLVLTALHCVTSATGQPPLSPDQMTFEAGYRNGTRTGVGHVSEVLRPAPAALAHHEDMALLRLTEPMAVRPLPLLPEGMPPKGRGLHGHGMMAGYGAPHPQRLAVESNCLVLGLSGSVLARHTCTSTNGSSGSPILWGLTATKDGRITNLEQARVAGLSIGYVADGSSPAGVLITAPALRDFMASVTTDATPAR